MNELTQERIDKLLRESQEREVDAILSQPTGLRHVSYSPEAYRIARKRFLEATLTPKEKRLSE